MSTPDEYGPRRRPPRKLKVDLMDLAAAVENSTRETAYFLDLDTGRIILITEDTRRKYDRIVISLGEVNPPQWTQVSEAALAECDLPDWQRESVREADWVEAGFGERYIRVPQADSREGYADMQAFIETVRNQRLAEGLWRAIQGRGAFRRFKDMLLDYPKERERWFAFRDARQRERVLEWLESEGIEPVSTPTSDPAVPGETQ